uniref:Uncharacterized protein n=1 Tax=Arundo donax TaxID=35708 RepID=A0A0A9E7A1_ARUDO
MKMSFLQRKQRVLQDKLLGNIVRARSHLARIHSGMGSVLVLIFRKRNQTHFGRIGMLVVALFRQILS